MRIDGRALAEEIYIDLRTRVLRLKQNASVPHVVVLVIGDNPASLAYIAQKKIHAEKIEAKVTIIKFPPETTTQTMLQTIEKFNTDASVHAILVQKPLPEHIDEETLDQSIIPEKDVDGFNHESKFILALPLAVEKILEYIFANEDKHPSSLDKLITPRNDGLVTWLKSQYIVVMGKGPTAGGPTISFLKKLGIQPHIIDSKTVNKNEVLKNADILIAAVGKEQAVKPEYIKKGVILIGVGLSRGTDGKIHGDYDEDAIKDIARMYTPTPGGVGPVNVACLMENVVAAAEQQLP